MFSFNEDKIVADLERFYSIIEQDSRADTLMRMYTDHFEVELGSAPASSVKHFHNAFPGGYLDHVLRVHDTAISMTKVYKDAGGDLNFTPEELRFSALHHDFGKLGDPGAPHYLIEDSDWHREKLGRYYKLNDKLQLMRVPDRALFTLQDFGIVVTRNEWLAISLSDGMHDASNSYYLTGSAYPYPMKSYLPHIVHMADYMSSLVEKKIPQTEVSFD